jgi:hypothetical protein
MDNKQLTIDNLKLKVDIRNAKSWELKLQNGKSGDVELVAVDSVTGERIIDFILFCDDGDVIENNSAPEELVKKGYNPQCKDVQDLVMLLDNLGF